MWKHLPRITAVPLLLIGSLATAFAVERDSRTEAAAAADLVDPIAMVDVRSDIEPMIDWAVALFAEADLDLPPVQFVQHDSVDACQGRAGRHRVVGERSVIDLCTHEASFATQVMVLHELAHAWAGHALTEEREAAFRELRGYTHWRDYAEAAWHENGTEQAAEIMVWGLVDRPLAIIRIDQNSCAELEAGYRALTGAAPLHGLEDYC